MQLAQFTRIHKSLLTYATRRIGKIYVAQLQQPV